LLRSFFNPEDGVDMFLGNMGLSPKLRGVKTTQKEVLFIAISIISSVQQILCLKYVKLCLISVSTYVIHAGFSSSQCSLQGLNKHKFRNYVQLDRTAPWRCM
jgi:hypothetical protein